MNYLWDKTWTTVPSYRQGCKGMASCLNDEWSDLKAQAGWRALWKHQNWSIIENWVNTNSAFQPSLPLFSNNPNAMKAFHYALAHPHFQPIWIEHALPDALHRILIHPKLLWMAVHYQQPHLLKALLKAGLSPWMALNLGNAPVGGKIAREGWIDGLETIIPFLSNINETDSQGNSLLHWAATTMQMEVIEWLLKQQAQPNIFNQKHHTPLGILLRNDFFSPIDIHHHNILPRVKDAVLLLIENGADPTLHQGKNKSARTALQWAFHHDPHFASIIEKKWLEKKLHHPENSEKRSKGRL